MPLGGARAGLMRPSAIDYGPFTLPSSITPTEGTAAAAATNAATWAIGDRLVALAGASHGDSTPGGYTPVPISWAGAGSETWAQHADDRAINGTSAVSANGYSTVALSAETAKAVTAGFGGAIFQSVRGLIFVGGPSIIRQVTPVAKVQDGTTTLTVTFGAAVLATSVIINFVAQRATTAFVQPADFTLLFAQNSSTNHRSVASARIGHSGTTVTSTGLSSTATASKLGFAIEIARPGQEP